MRMLAGWSYACGPLERTVRAITRKVGKFVTFHVCTHKCMEKGLFDVSFSVTSRVVVPGPDRSRY